MKYAHFTYPFSFNEQLLTRSTLDLLGFSDYRAGCNGFGTRVLTLDGKRHELTDTKQLTVSKPLLKIADGKIDKLATERRMLISAIRGSEPSHDLFDAFTTLKLGSYVGGFIDTWKWNSDSAFEDITILELRLMWEDLDQCWDRYKLKQQTIQNDK